MPTSSAPSTRTAPVHLRLPILPDEPQPAAKRSSPPRPADRKSKTGKGDFRAGDRREPYWHRRCQRPARARPPSARRPPTAPAEHGTPPAARRAKVADKQNERPGIFRPAPASSAPGAATTSIHYNPRLPEDSADSGQPPTQRTPDQMPAGREQQAGDCWRRLSHRGVEQRPRAAGAVGAPERCRRWPGRRVGRSVATAVAASSQYGRSQSVGRQGAQGWP